VIGRAPHHLIRMETAAPQAPPNPPELPEGANTAPPWPAWYAVAGFVVAAVAILIVVGILAAATGTTSDNQPSTFSIVATLLQEAILIGTAAVFASFTAPPRPWHFGLRSTRFWPAVGWAALGLFSFYVFAAVYSIVVEPTAKQNITQSLGADQGTLGLILAGLMVIAVAPVAEEFFFRGFFYRALRGRFPVVVAALIDGVVFGLIHYDSGLLLILPPLAVLGFILCLVYEQTGSIFPTIAIHALNNTVAYGVQAHAWSVSLVLGPLVIGGCMLAPRVIRPLRAAPAVR
jgi:membrane protease YdiL (CAAX protease family)